MTKKILFLLTFLLTTLGGGNFALAAEYTVMFDDGATQSTSGWFTVTGVTYQTDYHGTYGGHKYTKGAKIGSSANISFTTTVRSDVTIVQCISRSNDGNGPLKFDNTALQANQITAQEDSVYIEYTVTNVAAGSHSITKGNGQTGLFFIKVTEDVFTMEVNENDLYYGNAAYVGTTFPYISGVSAFRIKLNLNMPLSSSDRTNSHFTVSSNNTSVISVSPYSVAQAGSDDRLYYYVNVVGEGTATLTFNYDGTGSYSNAASCSKTFTITAPTFTAFNTSSPTYPYTWDFANNDWTSSKIQVNNHTETWAIVNEGKEARPKSVVSSIAAANGIDMIQGLAFGGCDVNSPCLDWTNKLIWMAEGHTITTPSLAVGQVITLDAVKSFATPSNTTKVGNNMFRVSTAGAITLTVPSDGCHILSISISSAGQATYETTFEGVFQFTGTGNLDGGTVIKDVPGIVATIGESGDTWTVTNQTQSGYYNGYVASGPSKDKTFILFKPSVNGFLSFVGTFYGVSSHIYVEDIATGEKIFDSSGSRLTTEQICSNPCIAGKTYKLYGGFYSSEFHGFSYSPAFLNTDNNAEQSGTYNAYPSETVFPKIVNASTSGVTFVSGTPSVATVVSDGDGTPTYVTTGTTTITATVTSPNSDVASKTASYTLRYKPADITPTLTFTYPTPSAVNYINYGDDMSGHSTFTNAIVSADPVVALDGATITYTSSNPSIATVDASGNLSIFNNGTVTITATMAAHGEYLQATQTYELAIIPTEASEMRLEHNSTAANPIVVPFGNGYTNKGTVYCGGVAHPEAYIFYTPEYVSSSTASVTTNVEEGIVTPVDMDDTDAKNVVAIRVHSDAYKQYTEATATYYIKIVQNTNVSLKFAPINRGNVNVGASITPYLGIGSVKGDKIGSLTAAIDNGCATGTTDLKTNWVLNPDGTVYKLNPVMTGVSTGTATITYTLADTKYYKGTTATYYLTVNASGTRNFRWNDADTPEYKVFQGDFMLMPLIDGNSNANNSYSNHSNNMYLYQVSPKKSSPSSLSDFNLTYNDNDYRLSEGIPDFAILNADKIDVSDKAVIFLGKGEGGRTGEKPDTLLIYALPIGGTTEQTVYIRAYEPADHSIFCDAKLTIMPKATLTAAYNNDVNAVTYPYTWDFTKDFDGSVITKIASDNVYWTPYGSDAYNIGGGFFNIKSYAKPNDKIYDSKNTNIYYQNFVADGATIPQFKGMMVSINGTSSWGNKVGRLQIRPTAGEGDSHLFFVGGYHELMLPDVSTSKIAPDNYKVFIKVKSNASGKVTCIQGSSSVEKTFGSSAPSILSFDATKTGGQVILRLNNAHVYWIAMSTEEMTARVPSANDVLSYAATTFSYNEDLDLGKSEEVNSDVRSYCANSFGASGNVGADGGNGYAVKLTRLNTEAKANEALIVKADVYPVEPTPFYMIAKGRNVESYTAPEAQPVNYLKPGTGDAVPHSSDGGASTNFVLSHAYKIYDNEGTATTGYRYDRDWSFYPIMSPMTINVGKAYLQVPGNLRVNTDGTITTNAPRRAAADDGRPATKAMLDIIFEDEPGIGSGATVISTINGNANVDSDAWYTLQGVRIDTPAKGGVYIHNGRKEVVK